MKEQHHFEGAQGPNQSLARWLTDILRLPQQEEQSPVSSLDAGAGIPRPELTGNYHLSFYQQLPDFIMALLTDDSQADIHYAPLLYHLAGCSECHQGYLELYQAMRAALSPSLAVTAQNVRSSVPTPQRMLGHLCQTLVSQAEAVLRQDRHDHTQETTELARSLLQQAIRTSAQITQSGIRRQALHDLVRVATFFDGPTSPAEERPDARSYTPVFAGIGGTRRGRHSSKIRRQADSPSRSSSQQEQPTIYLQSRELNGRIIQNDGILELHLHDLQESLRGRYITISVLLGSLLEPVRWVGGNPRAIRSSVPVDAQGTLVTPLGRTELRMADPEEHNLLEAIFMLLEVQAAASL